MIFNISLFVFFADRMHLSSIAICLGLVTIQFPKALNVKIFNICIYLYISKYKYIKPYFIWLIHKKNANFTTMKQPVKDLADILSSLHEDIQSLRETVQSLHV